MRIRFPWLALACATLARLCTQVCAQGTSFSSENVWPASLPSGPFSPGYGGGNAIDNPVAGFVGPAGAGAAPYNFLNGNQTVNPAFVDWASAVANYSPANPAAIQSYYTNPAAALGPVSGVVSDVVSLGDLKASDIAAGKSPGSITVQFTTPIGNGPGPDFVLFGNAFQLAGATSVFAKLAYVEVSTDGVNFARFPCIDTNPRPAGNSWPYMVSDPTKIYNLFGKALNAYGTSWGNAFDLQDLAAHPLVAQGLVDLQNIRFVRLVAIPGSGAYQDSLGNPIYSPWPTTGSPGPELQAAGVINAGHPPAVDLNLPASGARANVSALSATPAFTPLIPTRPKSLNLTGSTVNASWTPSGRLAIVFQTWTSDGQSSFNLFSYDMTQTEDAGLVHVAPGDALAAGEEAGSPPADAPLDGTRPAGNGSTPPSQGHALSQLAGAFSAGNLSARIPTLVDLSFVQNLDLPRNSQAAPASAKASQTDVLAASSLSQSKAGILIMITLPVLFLAGLLRFYRRA